MSVIAILAYIAQAVQLVSALAQAGHDVTGLLAQISDTIKNMQAENRNPSDAEWQGLDTQVANLRARLQAPRVAAPTA